VSTLPRERRVRTARPQRNYRMRRDWRKWLRRQSVEFLRHVWFTCVELGRVQCGGILAEAPPPGHPERMPGSAGQQPFRPPDPNPLP
jgi:hypothetical protein